MSIRKQGLAKVVAGLAILLAFIQASALQSVTGGATVWSRIGPFFCLAMAFLGLYEVITGRSVKTAWRAFARLTLAQRCGLAALAFALIAVLDHVLIASWGSPY